MKRVIHEDLKSIALEHSIIFGGCLVALVSAASIAFLRGFYGTFILCAVLICVFGWVMVIARRYRANRSAVEWRLDAGGLRSFVGSEPREKISWSDLREVHGMDGVLSFGRKRDTDGQTTQLLLRVEDASLILSEWNEWARSHGVDTGNSGLDCDERYSWGGLPKRRVLGLVILVIGVFVSCFAITRAVHQAETARWPSATGVVVAANLREFGSRKVTESETAEFRMSYEYVVGSQKFQLDQLTLGSSTYSKELKLVRQFSDTLRADGPVRVYYNPKKPEQAVILPGPDWREVFRNGLASVLLLTIGSGIMAGWWRSPTPNGTPRKGT